MERYKIILELYFVHKMKQKQIAEKLNISKYIVSRVLRSDGRYYEEKKARVKESEKKHREKTSKYITEKRAKERNNNEYEAVEKQHIQASLELSNMKGYISNKAFRDWNSSIYKYDKKTKSYKLKSNIVATSDVPKSIKW